jgi:hypothetical protein
MIYEYAKKKVEKKKQKAKDSSDKWKQIARGKS